MLCFKCGTKLSEDAVFCHNCGYKTTMKAESDVNSELENESQLINSLQEISSAQNELSDSDSKVFSEMDEKITQSNNLYNRLRDNSKSCVRIKDIILKEHSGTGLTPVIKSLFFNYKCCYNPINKDIVIFNSPTWLYYIISILCIICDGVFLTFLFEEEYFLPLSTVLILECIFWLIFLIWCFKEQKEVISYINQSLGLNLKISKVPTIISAILNTILILAGVVTLWFSIEDIISFNRYNEEDYGYEESLYDENNEENNYYDIDNLSLTYENSEYGFSFKYPDNWNIEDFTETIVYLHPADGMWYYSAMSVSSGYATEYDCETLFSASEEYFKEEYLYAGIENVEIINLQNVVLNDVPARKIKVNYINSNGEDIIETLYLYYANSQIYTVTFVSLEMFIDDYEPIFDAIIESYTINVDEEESIEESKNISDAYNIFFVYDYVGLSIDEIISAFGEPTEFTEGYGVNYAAYDGIIFNFDASRIVSSVEIYADMCVIGEGTFEHSRKYFIDLLGEPSEEGWDESFYDGNYYDMYYMTYLDWDMGMCFRIEMLSPDVPAYGVYVWGTY